jgi:hypothetical protein
MASNACAHDPRRRLFLGMASCLPVRALCAAFEMIPCSAGRRVQVSSAATHRTAFTLRPAPPAVAFASTPLNLACAGGKQNTPAGDSARIYLCPRHAVKVMRVSGGNFSAVDRENSSSLSGLPPPVLIARFCPGALLAGNGLAVQWH